MLLARREAAVLNNVSDITMGNPFHGWVEARVIDTLHSKTLVAYGKGMGLDFSEVVGDGSLRKSPRGGGGTGKNPTDRAKLGWKWSSVTERHGIPSGVAIDGVNPNDSVIPVPTFDDAERHYFLAEVETLWLDQGYATESRSSGQTRLGCRRNSFRQRYLCPGSQ